MSNHLELHPAAALRAVALPDVIGARDLAQHLDLSEETIRRHLRAGVLPGRKIGRRWYVSRRDLLAFLGDRPSLRLVSGKEVRP